tara:strand:- start:4528 stop:5058 length:531 start_codon:yes stop_codon:yes gene_type:complete
MKTKKKYVQVPCSDHPSKMINAGKNHPNRCDCKTARKMRKEFSIKNAEQQRAIKHINENPADKGKAESLKYLKERSETRAKFYIQARTNHLAYLARKEEARKKREDNVTAELFGGKPVEEVVTNEIAQKLIEAVGGIPVVNKSGKLMVKVPTKTARAKNPTKLVSIKAALELGQGS